MALDQAVKVGLLTRNVIKETEPPKLTKKEIHPMNKKQAAKLAEVAKAAMEAATEEKTVRDSAYMAILLALATGARLGEILGLKWDCVNLDKGIIYIRRVLDLKQKGGIFNEPKTAKSQRQIPLPADVAKELKKYKTRQEWQKHLLGDKWEGCGDEKKRAGRHGQRQSSGLVITNHFGRPLNASNFEADTSSHT
jgi:integrase